MRASYDARLFEFGFAPKADLRRIGRGIGREIEDSFEEVR